MAELLLRSAAPAWSVPQARVDQPRFIGPTGRRAKGIAALLASVVVVAVIMLGALPPLGAAGWILLAWAAVSVSLGLLLGRGFARVNGRGAQVAARR